MEQVDHLAIILLPQPYELLYQTNFKHYFKVCNPIKNYLCWNFNFMMRKEYFEII